MRSTTTGGSAWHPGATAALHSSTSTRPTTSWWASSRPAFPPDRPRWRPAGASWCGATSSSGPEWWCAARSSCTTRATAGSASRTAPCSRGEMTREPPTVAAALRRSRRPAEAVLDHVGDTGDVIVGLGNGEPATVVDALEAGHERLRDVRVHQMFPLRERRYMLGEVAGLRHVSWFLSPVVRDAFHRGGCDLVPNNFSDVPRLMRASTGCSLVLAAVSPPDRHGYFSLGCHAEYVAPMVGAVPFFVEVNHQMPRTFGENQVHVSQVLGWCEADYPLVEVPHPPPRDTDRRIAQHVAERVPDGATVQAGVGSVPNEVLKLLSGHRDLGIHTELLADGFVDLVEQGVVTGTRKTDHVNKIVTTSAMGSARLYRFVDENPGVEFWPVDHTNDRATSAARRAWWQSTPPWR